MNTKCTLMVSSRLHTIFTSSLLQARQSTPHVVQSSAYSLQGPMHPFLLHLHSDQILNQCALSPLHATCCNFNKSTHMHPNARSTTPLVKTKRQVEYFQPCWLLGGIQPYCYQASLATQKRWTLSASSSHQTWSYMSLHFPRTIGSNAHILLLEIRLAGWYMVFRLPIWVFQATTMMMFARKDRYVGGPLLVLISQAIF